MFSWPDFDREAWRVVVDEAVAAARPMPPLAIMGNDWHHGALSLAWVGSLTPVYIYIGFLEYGGYLYFKMGVSAKPERGSHDRIYSLPCGYTVE